MRVNFQEKAFVVYFVMAETEETVIDSVFLSKDKAQEYTADYNDWEKKNGSKDYWYCKEVNFDNIKDNQL